MLSKVTVLAFAAVASAQQTFDSKFLSAPFEMYPTDLKGQLMDIKSDVNNILNISSLNGTFGDGQFKCQYMAGLNFYDLQPLGLAKPYYQVPAQDAPNRTLYISFCQDLPEALWCDKEPLATMAVLKEVQPDGSETCVTLSGDSPTQNAAFNVSDPDNNDGLAIEYNGGAPGYNLLVDVQCDHDQDFLFLSSSLADNEHLLLSFKTRVGCKYDQLSQIWEFFTKNQWAMFAFFVIAGGMLCFTGRALLKPTLFITGVFIAMFVIVYIFYTTFLKTNTEQWVGWAVLAGSALVGVILGYILQKFAKVGAFCLAAWGGFSLGLILYNAFVYKLNGGEGLFWGTCIGSAAILGVLTIVMFDHILIQSTAIIGSFMFCYGIGLVAGHYPNPFTIAELIKNGQLVDNNIDPLYYAYMGGNLLLYIIGCVVQYRHKKSNPNYDPEERFRRKHR